ncbi:MAG: hypothetical protein QXJ72_07640 [Thermoproteota archaeon]
MEKRIEEKMRIDKVKHDARSFARYMEPRLTGKENSVFKKPMSL